MVTSASIELKSGSKAKRPKLLRFLFHFTEREKKFVLFLKSPLLY